MFKNIAAFFLATILALGCGGGGGSSTPRRPAILPEIPLQTTSHAPQAPIVDFSGTLHVGSGVKPEINQLEKAGVRGEISISSGHVQDGVGLNTLLMFGIEVAIDGGQLWGLPTFPNPPVVRIARGTSDEHISHAVRTVQVINASLPHDRRISFSDNPAPPLVTVDNVPQGEIFIDFAPKRD